ncbi:MAG: uncharacterized protein A8A55_2936 [Amphiamblys sp. WSBS2006]|nr:MAG: uncharacterized protein A8A55_2936 [Amphiamblys sp. WSBS2006]
MVNSEGDKNTGENRPEKITESQRNRPENPPNADHYRETKHAVQAPEAEMPERSQEAPVQTQEATAPVQPQEAGREGCLSDVAGETIDVDIEEANPPSTQEQVQGSDTTESGRNDTDLRSELKEINKEVSALLTRKK